jgi:hypothetical protein
VFYNCLKATLIYRDFSKGLGVAVVAKATSNLASIAPTDEVPPLDSSVILNVIEVTVGEAVEKPMQVKL